MCNHPELFERRDAKSPLFINTEIYEMPVLLYTEGLLHISQLSINHLLFNKLFIFAVEYIHRSLNLENERSSIFSFMRFINLSPMELNKIFIEGILFR